jgi:hypothetical protein
MATVIDLSPAAFFCHLLTHRSADLLTDPGQLVHGRNDPFLIFHAAKLHIFFEPPKLFGTFLHRRALFPTYHDLPGGGPPRVARC